MKDYEYFHMFCTPNIKPSFSMVFLVDGGVIIMPVYIIDSLESKVIMRGPGTEKPGWSKLPHCPKSTGSEES